MNDKNLNIIRCNTCNNEINTLNNEFIILTIIKCSKFSNEYYCCEKCLNHRGVK